MKRAAGSRLRRPAVTGRTPRARAAVRAYGYWMSMQVPPQLSRQVRPQLS